MSLAGVVIFFKGLKKDAEISHFSSLTLFEQQAGHCAFFNVVSVDLILVIFFLSFLCRSLLPPRIPSALPEFLHL